MSFDFREDCRPRILKTVKINANFLESESRKFDDAKIFQYRYSMFIPSQGQEVVYVGRANHTFRNNVKKF